MDLENGVSPVISDSGVILKESPHEILESAGSGAQQFYLIRTSDEQIAVMQVQSVPRDKALAGVAGIDDSPYEDKSTSEMPEPVEEYGGSVIIDDLAEEWEASFTFAVTDESATFMWNRASGEFFIQSEMGEPTKSVDGLASISGLEPGTEYKVIVEGTVPDATGELVPATRYISFTTLRGSELRDFETGGGSVLQPFVYQNIQTKLTYRTFISSAVAPAAQCNFLDPTYWFGGDDRSTEMPLNSEPFSAPSSRTIMFAASNWMEPVGSRLYTYKTVGASTLYKLGVLQDTQYASTDDMLFQAKAESAGYAQVRFNHTAGIPFCKLFDFYYGGSIKYNVMVKFYQSGTVEIDGWRRPVPDHEVWAGLNNAPIGTYVSTSWYLLYHGTNSGFHCLLGGCTDQSISETVSN